MMLKKFFLCVLVVINLTACNSVQVTSNKYIKAIMSRIDSNSDTESSPVVPPVKFLDPLVIPDSDRILLGKDEFIFNADNAKKLKPLHLTEQHRKTFTEVLRKVKTNHISPVNLDENQFKDILRSYLLALDAQKSLFLESDIREFLSYYKLEEDEQLKGKLLESSYKVFNRYRDRLFERNQFILHIINSQMSSLMQDSTDELQYQRSDIAWLYAASDLRKLWEQQLQHETLLLRMQGHSAKAIQKLLAKRYLYERRYIANIASETILTTYINAYLDTFDAHSNYTPVRDNNDEFIEIKSLGIVVLHHYGKLEVIQTVAGGSAQHILSAGDSIIAMGTEDKQMFDVADYNKQKLSALINKLSLNNNQLLIDVRKKDIPLYIERIPFWLDHSEYLTARSSRIKIRSEYIGVIHIPSFYVDIASKSHQEYGFKQVSRDVERLVIELMKKGVSGIVFDLRGNTGGSLHEVSKTIGLFIPQGPTVQVRSKRGIQTLYDDIPSILYQGPIAVLVDRNTASAAETFAAAIQDYNIGLIIGSDTNGHGTIASQIKLSEGGSLVLTQAKTYRVNGNGLQLQGVEPDIKFMPFYSENPLMLQASILSNDTVERAEFQPLSTNTIANHLDALKTKHLNREKDSRRVRRNASLNKYINDIEKKQTSSLQIDKRRSDLVSRIHLTNQVIPLMKQSGVIDSDLNEAAHALMDVRAAQ